MIHRSYGRNNRPGTKGSVDKVDFLFSKKPIGRLNADRPLATYHIFDSRAVISSIRPMNHDPSGSKELNLMSKLDSRIKIEFGAARMDSFKLMVIQWWKNSQRYSF